MPRNANDILDQATPDQVKWVIQRLTNETDKDAAIAVGVHPSTVSKWPNKADLDLAVSLLLREPIEASLTILRDGATQAAKAMIDALKTEDDKLKLTAANDILDRIGVGGKPETEINIKFDLDQWKSERQKRLDAIAQLPEVEGDAATDA